MALRAYSPQQVVVTVGGLPITAKAEDEFCTVAQNEEDSTLQMGADGEAAVMISNNLSGRVTIKVLGGSEANDICMAAYIVWKSTKVPTAIFIKDLNGRSLHTAEKAWPVKVPDKAYAKAAGEVEWVFETDRLISFVGGANFL
jgi:hypothetical protein